MPRASHRVAPMSDYLVQRLERLAAAIPCGYGATLPATEPTALAALALLAHDRADAAQPALAWLASLQNADGSVGINATESTPCWPTGIAALAWLLAPAESGLPSPFRRNVERAIAWILTARGKPQAPSSQLGHNTMLIGWPWVDGTHSWIEPTAWNVLALKATGHAAHPRTREAVRLLIDRLLPSGGCNYGNTIVLGQELRPHLQPTGLALLALAGEETDDLRVNASLQYLQRQLSAPTATASLCYGLLGLAARGVSPPSAEAWLSAAAERLQYRKDSDWRIALIALASLGERCPLIQLTAAAV